MICEKIILGFCLVAPSNDIGSSIFSFAEFISALALLIIVYMITDIRYRFRLSIAPGHLPTLTYVLIGVIGFVTLLTDIWIAEGWLVPITLPFLSLFVWQGMFGTIFLVLVMTWIYYAFIRPPIFCKNNYRVFHKKLYRIILKGADSDLSIIASELQRSAVSLVQHSKQNLQVSQDKSKDRKNKSKQTFDISHYAYDLLLLIGNKKLCRNIIGASPITAIVFFEAIADKNKFDLPIKQFARNITTEAILNKDSILYHEDEGYTSGLMGYLKPFSKAIYGNYQLVEAVGSPLDIDYKLIRSWDASQLEAYTRIVKITLESYLKSDYRNQHSYALYNAFENIKNSQQDVYKLNDISQDYYSEDITNRQWLVVSFVIDAIELIDKQKDIPSTVLRARDNHIHSDIYDQLASLMFDIIFSATSVKKPFEKCWDIQYCSVWSRFFGLSYEGKAWKITYIKLRRLLYDEILRLDEFPNYKSTRILGFCLNVMGFKLDDKNGYRREEYALHKVVLAWTRKNYLQLRSVHPDVAESCLIGGISFDEREARLVKSYAKGLSLEIPKVYLELCEISNIEN